jgi:predicted metal-dependent phosphoesterase TrpH
MSQSIATTDHDEIRRWVESRKGHPAVVKSTHRNGQEGGLLRIDFDPPEDSLERIEWEEFFDTFDDNGLAFLYQEETASGGKSRFNKFVSRDSVDAEPTSGRRRH